MHKKKNPLTVLSGELVLNFRKAARGTSVAPAVAGRDPAEVVRECCEKEIVCGLGATTETIHHALVPRLLETGLLRRFSREYGDITPLLKELFDFEESTGRWQLREGAWPLVQGDVELLVRYTVARFLTRSGKAEQPLTTAEVCEYVRQCIPIGAVIRESAVRRILAELAYSPDGERWFPAGARGQKQLF